MSLKTWIVTTTIALASAETYDPINNYCARWNHQSVLKNGYLYIDGGLQTYVAIGKNVQGINKEVIRVDMRSSWDWKTNITLEAINKTENPSTGSIAPSLLRGGLYSGSAADENLYTYGGTWSQFNKSFSNSHPDPSTYSLWSYAANDSTWNQYDLRTNLPHRPSRGQYAEAPDQGLGFYLNGQLDDGSESASSGFGDDRVALKGMAVLNFTNPTSLARNVSTDVLFRDAGIIGGVVVYVTEVGSKGVLVAFGGTQRSASQPDSTEGLLIKLDSINVFDIASLYNTTTDDQWYKQAATGTIPPSRVDFCAISVASPDNSSHNIYIYGGRNPVSRDIYDDIYILSLPSFIWTKMYSGDSPRYGHTCHLVGKRQMLTVGGQSSTNLTKNCDWELKGVGIMDLSTKIWGSVFNVNAQPYKVTQEIVDEIGGTTSGGATTTSPAAGFAEEGLSELFKVKAATAVPTPTTYGSNNGKKSHAGAIAGGVLGAILGLAFLGTLAWFSMRRRRGIDGTRDHKYAAESQEIDSRLVQEMDGSSVQELSAAEKKHCSELHGDTQPVELDAVERSDVK